MNKQIDVNATIKPIRLMTFLFTAILFVYIAIGLYFIQVGMSSIPAGGIFIIAISPLAPLPGALNSIFHAFRSQQLEIDQLKTTVQQLQCADEHAKVE